MAVEDQPNILNPMAMGKAIIFISVGCEGLDVADWKNFLTADNPEYIANRIAEW